MALEPITRKEQIIAGEDLKPITRMEKFLKQYGGGGGNGSGGGGVKLLLFKTLDDVTFSANMTLSEALACIDNCELFGAVRHIEKDGTRNVAPASVVSDITGQLGAECLMVIWLEEEITIFWTSGGISTEPPF